MRAFWILFLFLISFSLVGCIYKETRAGRDQRSGGFRGVSLIWNCQLKQTYSEIQAAAAFDWAIKNPPPLFGFSFSHVRIITTTWMNRTQEAAAAAAAYISRCIIYRPKTIRPCTHTRVGEGEEEKEKEKPLGSLTASCLSLRLFKSVCVVL